MNTAIDSSSAARKTSVCLPEPNIDSADDYFDEIGVELTPRQVVLHFIDAITDLRERDYSYSKIASWLTRESGVRVHAGAVQRALIPISAEDPSPAILTEQRVRLAQKRIVQQYTDQAGALKSGRPRNPAPSPVTKLPGTAAGNFTLQPTPSPDDMKSRMSGFVRSIDDPETKAEMAALLTAAKARKAAALTAKSEKQ
jgi:hypothetical protein